MSQYWSVARRFRRLKNGWKEEILKPRSRGLQRTRTIFISGSPGKGNDLEEFAFDRVRIAFSFPAQENLLGCASVAEAVRGEFFFLRTEKNWMRIGLKDG
ncbi:hypothetical protein [Prolixibacter sp. NT017]|uniref:hypothetical protein n=1 Tax=Prolixibacter sp. NT017 TaxID=2652390 RepID=UPI0012993BB4|nr:hypothetical protein [Prolixibacter sp. NT017]